MKRNNLEATMRHVRAGVQRDLMLNTRVRTLEKAVISLSKQVAKLARRTK